MKSASGWRWKDTCRSLVALAGRVLSPGRFSEVFHVRAPPIPTAKATLEQVRASLERGIAQARAGLTEDFDVVQARMRAKYGVRSR